MGAQDRTYDQLLQDERRLRTLIEHGHDLLITLDASFAITYISLSSETILGRTPRELIGVPALQLVHPDDVERVAGLLLRAIQEPGERIEDRVRVLHADGSTRELAGRGVSLLHDPNVGALVIAIRDVTEREQQAAALAKSEERFRMLADRARDIIARYRIEPEPKLEYISPAVERITGYTPEEYYADPHLHVRLIHEEDRSRLATLMQRTPEEMGIPITLRWVRKDGESVWIEQSLVPELDAQGRMVAMESISRDVTEQVRLEGDLRRAQKLDAVGRLAGGIAHDFNNLLGVTLLCGERLKRAVEHDPSLNQWVDMILDSARRGSELSQQLLAFARKEAARDTACDVHLVVRALQPMLQGLLPESMRLQLDLKATEPDIKLSKGQLEQLLVNLVVNARDAMPRGGAIAVRTANRPVINQASLRSTTSDAMPRGLVLQVADQGVGMDDTVLERVFEPFFTTKAPNDGSGLGLSVVYGIVTQSGGQIAVRSEPGEGSVFTMCWPLDESGEARAREPEPIVGGHETVLLVEDAALLLALEADMLERLGYRVLRAGTGVAAERCFEAALREGRAPELLLVDVGLPDDDGVALATRLLARVPSLRVVYTTGDANEDLVRRATIRGQLTLVTKPFTEAELAHVVRAALDRPKPV
jgi:PAS domain S-box-containing protein